MIEISKGDKNRGEELLETLHYLQWKYRKKGEIIHLGREVREVVEWIADLSSDDFNALMSQSVGNFFRIHYSQIRKRRKKEGWFLKIDEINLVIIENNYFYSKYAIVI